MPVKRAVDIVLPPNKQAERWKPIKGYPGYEVSSRGRVRSWLKRGHHNDRYNTKPQLLRPVKRSRKGYLYVALSRSEENGTFRAKAIPIHQLVLEAFHGPKPSSKHDACHYPDPNSTKNWASNLRWGTRAENMQDQLEHGTRVNGEKHGRAKLTEADIYEIRTLLAQGTPQATIAALKGVRQQTISKINTRSKWQHLK